MSWLHGAAVRLRLLVARRATEARVNREFEFHIQMETERLVRELGLEPKEARRRALVAFGGVEKHREALRDGRDLAGISGWALDFKLGLRMLVKYPGLTLVGVLGISVAVSVGALAFTAVNAVTRTSLPFDEGDRVVAIQNIDLRRGDRVTHLHDLTVWRETLRAVDDISAFRSGERNLSSSEVAPVTIRVAEITASGFRLARVAPIRGRYLRDDDERQGSPAVAVIGYELWHRTFGGRDDVVGTGIQLGETRYTVVGVMPKGFAFPVNEQAWTPLRVNPSTFGVEDGASVTVFGRLAPGASLADASTQLTAVAARLAAENPQRHKYLRSRVVPYTRSFTEGLISSLLPLGEVVITLLLVVIATNVAILVYARTASRAGELAVRTALGAGRARLVMQLFAEALVLSGVASMLGLVVAHVVFARVEAMIRQTVGAGIPYWMRLEITPGVIVYVAGLAVLAAAIIGVVPGLKATHHRVSENLKDLSGGASSRLGRSWTALLVTQVAVSVAALPVATAGARMWLNLTLVDHGTPLTRSFMIATPLVDDVQRRASILAGEEQAARARYSNRVADIVRTLAEEPGSVDAIRMAPGPGDEEWIHLDPVMTTGASDTATITQVYRSVAISRVDSQFFAAFNLRLLGGRRFTAADFASRAPAAIVNRAFVERILGGANALGWRVRQELSPAKDGANAGAASRPSWEIVGVVEDLPKPETQGAYTPMVYLPLRPAGVYPITLAVRAPSLTSAAVSERIRMVSMSVDPTLRFTRIRTLDDVLNAGLEWQRWSVLALVLVLVSVVLLSAAGIYALMAFTVTRRQREIGIRMALGARGGRVLVEILSRALRQIGTGIAIGVLIAPVVFRFVGNSSTWSELGVQIARMAAMAVVVGLLATIGPARRALRVQPTEALRTD